MKTCCFLLACLMKSLVKKPPALLLKLLLKLLCLSLLSLPMLGQAGDAQQQVVPLYAAPYLSEQARALISAHKPSESQYPALGELDQWGQRQQATYREAKKRWQRLQQQGLQFKRESAAIPGVNAYWLTTPKTTNSTGVLVFTHGGAYVGGSGEFFSPTVVKIANLTGMRVLSVDYRLAPQAPFPAAVDDSVQVYRWLLDQGFKAKKIGWFGESAGGGLTLAAILAIKQQQLPLPGAAVVLSPWTDLTLSSESYFTLDADDPGFTRGGLLHQAKAYYGDADPRNPLISPVFGDFNGFPPLLIQAGSKEMLLSDALRVARQARAAGVDVTLDIWDGLWHVFQFTGVPESDQALGELGRFFRKHLN